MEGFVDWVEAVAFKRMRRRHASISSSLSDDTDEDSSLDEEDDDMLRSSFLGSDFRIIISGSLCLCR
jgi:hypothetical protein